MSTTRLLIVCPLFVVGSGLLAIHLVRGGLRNWLEHGEPDDEIRWAIGLWLATLSALLGLT